jgi:hypothetical protein
MVALPAWTGSDVGAFPASKSMYLQQMHLLSPRMAEPWLACAVGNGSWAELPETVHEGA